MTGPTPPMNIHTAPDILTVEEAAKLLRIGRNSAYESVRTGAIPSIKIGKRILIPKVTLERLLSKAEVK